ncbi:unnamed protein product [Spirodela intermedia]|uniref:procollagen-proline 4-dioxygenase n=1 Tax=Spirodela intermedia TaxID=51605 RepID=A0A7I8IPH6_SPIIN|nr:unnamed protein product [Spirodela intermedia]CAA6659042.1 unnamed protein product [Spirodela intermedia]
MAGLIRLSPIPSRCCCSFLLSASSPLLSHSEIQLGGEEQEHFVFLDRNSSTDGFDPTRITQLSWRPRAFLYEGFLSHEECDHIIEIVPGKEQVGEVNGSRRRHRKAVMSDVRTSSGMFLEKNRWAQIFLPIFLLPPTCRLQIDCRSHGSSDEIVARIERRIALWTFLPKVVSSWEFQNGESIHVLRYKRGQKYESHFDYFVDKVNREIGGNRYATVSCTSRMFRREGRPSFQTQRSGKHHHEEDDSWSECARNGYAVKPKKGDALLFFSLRHDATADAASLHGSCPRRGGCVDEDLKCPQWAAAGECQKNPLYMVGSKSSLGFCRRSCKVCSS